MSTPAWLSLRRGSAPLIVSIPHAGTEIPPHLDGRYESLWLARRDADWWVDRLYSFASDLDATIVATRLSRSVIDVNRDPSGASLYPGQATTELCPTTTFDGEPLYRPGQTPDAVEIAARIRLFFNPYHAALASEIDRLRRACGTIVVYDAHSIRSEIPRLFEGRLPNFNIGTNSGASCDAALTAAIEAVCNATAWSHVTNGRFKGGYVTRSYGDPGRGIHALQMELACRGYMAEPPGAPTEDDWPPSFDVAAAAPMVGALRSALTACLDFARSRP